MFYTTLSAKEMAITSKTWTTSYLVDGLPNKGPGARSQGIEVRDFYAEYFMGPGSVPFQYNKILKKHQIQRYFKNY